MKKFIQTITIPLLLTTLFSFGVRAQVVQPKNQMYKKRIVRAIDLREKQNKPLYARNIEFTNLLLEAIKNDQIKAYNSDSLTSTLSQEEVLKQLVLISEYEEVMDTSDMDDFEKEEYLSYSSTPAHFEGRDLYQIELTQDWIFDNHKSVVNKENIAITIYIPADHPDNIRGIQTPVATVSFKECTELWKDNPNATWFNTYNDAAHLNLSDAFKLELYHSYIVKVSNADNSYIADDFPDRRGIMESMNQEARLMEYESNVWEN